MSKQEMMTLQGDEDCGVSLACRRCDRGGLPLAYYGGISGNPYDDVPTAETIEELAYLARRHAHEHNMGRLP